MKVASKVLLAVGLLSVLALAAAGPPLDAKEKEKAVDKEKAAAAARENNKKKVGENSKRWGGNTRPHAGERMTPEIMEDRRKASALFAAVVLPVTPKDVTFPLSEENHLKFHAAREGLMEFVHSESKGFDLKNEDTKKTLRQKTTDNQEQTRQLLLAAVKAGKTLQQARVGLIIAQFEKLDPKVQEAALAKGKERLDKMPAGARDKASNRQVEKHKSELAELSALKTDAEKEDWLNKKYKPSVAKVPKLLQ